MDSINELFSGKYHLLDSTLEAFAGHLLEENPVLQHGKETLIARFPKDPPSGDGQSVDVYCCAMPAEFFTIKALEAQDSLNKPKKPFELRTGSGMAEIARVIAANIAEGMLSLRENRR